MYKICRKQYVGQRVDIFCRRWNYFKINDRKYLVGEYCMQEHIFEHFNSEGQTDFLENLSVTFIDKTDIQSPEWRENHWIQTLTTVAPYDLNILSSVWIALFSFTRFLGHGMFKDKIYGHIIYLLRIIFFLLFIY